MDKRETRRINPAAHVAACAVLILVVFEGLVIFGALELRAQTVAKYAPWAYEPFLRFVGEHPQSMPRWAAVEKAAESDTAESAAAEAAGLELSSIPLLVGTNETAAATNETAISTNSAPDTLLPGAPSPEPETADPPAQTPETRPDDIEPVG